MIISAVLDIWWISRETWVRLETRPGPETSSRHQNEVKTPDKDVCRVVEYAVCQLGR